MFVDYGTEIMYNKLYIEKNVVVSRYGHSMGIYKGNAYIYGGTRLESSTNELNIMNLKSMTLSNLPSAPFRRK